MDGLVVSDMSVMVDGHRLVQAANLVAQPRRITALIGPNGAGKSTLMRAILGLVPAATGQVHFDGADLLAMPRMQRARTAAFVEQSATTEERLSARDVVALGRIPFQSLWQSGPSAEDLFEIEAAVRAVEMTDLASRLFVTLSGGERQRIHLARALAQKPRLLVLDEPTSHLDINAQLLVLDVLRRAADTGVTVLIALHDLNLAAAHCDSIVVMNQGKVLASGNPAEVLTPPLLAQVYGVRTTLLHHPRTGQLVITYETRNSN